MKSAEAFLPVDLDLTLDLDSRSTHSARLDDWRDLMIDTTNQFNLLFPSVTLVGTLLHAISRILKHMVRKSSASFTLMLNCETIHIFFPRWWTHSLNESDECEINRAKLPKGAVSVCVLFLLVLLVKSRSTVAQAIFQ